MSNQCYSRSVPYLVTTTMNTKQLFIRVTFYCCPISKARAFRKLQTQKCEKMLSVVNKTKDWILNEFNELVRLLCGGVKSRVLASVRFKQTSVCILLKNINSERPLNYLFIHSKGKLFRIMVEDPDQLIAICRYICFNGHSLNGKCSFCWQYGKTVPTSCLA